MFKSFPIFMPRIIRGQGSCIILMKYKAHPLRTAHNEGEWPETTSAESVTCDKFQVDNFVDCKDVERTLWLFVTVQHCFPPRLEQAILDFKRMVFA